jgi:hypothetical protein
MSLKIELEFIPVCERLPEEEASYFVCYEAADFDVCRFNPLNKAFNSLCPELTITHWAALPDLSKASENNSRSEFKERILKEIAANREAKNPQEQRRRDLFERVAVATITHAYDNEAIYWVPEKAESIAEGILKAADKFARGE